MLVMLSMNSLIIDMDLCCWLKANVYSIHWILFCLLLFGAFGSIESR